MAQRTFIVLFVVGLVFIGAATAHGVMDTSTTAYLPIVLVPEPSPTPEPTATPKPTATPEPTAAPAPEPSPTATQPVIVPTADNRCHPSYPDFCIPPPPPDLDCGDISARNFTVLPPDPHRFDRDRDGIGCES